MSVILWLSSLEGIWEFSFRCPSSRRTWQRDVRRVIHFQKNDGGSMQDQETDSWSIAPGRSMWKFRLVGFGGKACATSQLEMLQVHVGFRIRWRRFSSFFNEGARKRCFQFRSRFFSLILLMIRSGMIEVFGKFTINQEDFWLAWFQKQRSSWSVTTRPICEDSAASARSSTTGSWSGETSPIEETVDEQLRY